MDFRQFCEDEKISLSFLKEYKQIIENSKKSNNKNIILKKPKVDNSQCNKGFFGNPNEPVKNDFEKFDIHSHIHFEPYMEKSGPFTFCDKCNGTTSPDYLNNPKYFKKNKTILKKEIPEHLMGRIPCRKSVASSSSSEPEDEDKKPKESVLYKIIVKTNCDIKAGTSCPVFIRFVDKLKKSEPIELKKNFGSLKFYFAPNSTENFYIKSIPISDLKNVNIKLQTEKDSDEWFPEWLRVEEMVGEKRKWYCKIDKYLSSTRKDCKLVAQLKAVRITVPLIKYQIKVKVSHESVDECYGLLSIKLSGSLLKTDVLKLNNSKYSKIKCGTTPNFTIEHEEIGIIKAIWLSISSSSNLSEPEEEKERKEKNKQNFRKVSETSEAVQKKPNQRKGWEDIKVDSVIIEWVDSEKRTHSVEFICNKWIGLSDKMTQKSVLLKSPVENKKWNKSKQLKSDSLEETTYKITFFTSKKTLGGTDATIYVKLYGKKGFWSQTYEFDDYDKKMFEAGSQDSFTVNGPDVGTVTKINVWHDNKGFASGWNLDKISVIRHLTPTEICETLEQMKKKSQLPKAIKLQNGELFIDNDVLQESLMRVGKSCELNTVGIAKRELTKAMRINKRINEIEDNDRKDDSPIRKQTSASSNKKKGQIRDPDSDISSSSSSIDKTYPKSSEGSSKNKTANKSVTQIFTLPFAEETKFSCDKWLSKDVANDSLNKTFAAEGSGYLSSTINLLINPDN